jgi:hypothetical protein
LTDNQQPDSQSPAALLAAYDEQLRGEAEVSGAVSWDRSGPLYRGVFSRGGFVSYDSLDGVDDIDALIADTIAFFAAIPQVEEFEWKTRGHDHPADLGERLEAAGFVPDEIETVMVGDAAGLAQDIDLPDAVTVRRVDQLPDRDALVTEAAEMQRAVFGDGPSAEEVIERLDRLPGLEEYWVVEAVEDAGRRVISAGRLNFVENSDFAGLWGGATVPEWRGRGVYRALTAARARSTLAAGKRYLHSDCSAMSRPILERSGLVAVTTTTPYLWRR